MPIDLPEPVAGWIPVRNTAAAILFLQAGMYTMDAMSTLNSSPWTSENFGADAEKAKSGWEYVCHALVVGGFYCGVSAVIASPDVEWYPIVGYGINAAYLLWIYKRALDRGKKSGSTSWQQS